MTDIRRLDDPHITLVPGFLASGVACGLKRDGDLDLALIASDVPCAAAAVFTTNRVQAAPVLYDKNIIRTGAPVQAVVINSGCANACTGDRGVHDVHQTSEHVAKALNIPADTVFVMSTGVIGQTLPMDKVAAGIVSASQVLSRDGGHAAARAIMTTDTVPKEAAARIHVGGKTVTVAGICKGAGMIHPNMATMLAMVVTDAAIRPDVLQIALHTVADRTFNMITVDGDTSTNDTLLFLASGEAGNEVISDTSSEDYRTVVDGLLDAAKQIAKSIAHSPLVKTAIYGQDANWGRVICAAGYSGVEFDPARLSLWMETEADALHLVKGGAPFEIDEPRAAAILAQDQVVLRLDLGTGQAEATVWTCDLTHRYVDINAHYRT
jgi:glutamate N-acetyltransferase/amino-acid N-acetyltransferase